eukprot:CAMPEP_0114321962 /NCGR_PEP_ID=MMETSP0059-20121206/26935_1 /TAXON_ID=36894 /ORGANISM="Pyramimonas parkeae, Strain CCMP726" /LENGTH=71 /DNA_ID=CAMNT_0001449833 /DNA_START=726 /DNA_END=942 /DNA_ORIENTATION=-
MKGLRGAGEALSLTCALPLRANALDQSGLCCTAADASAKAFSASPIAKYTADRLLYSTCWPTSSTPFPDNA